MVTNWPNSSLPHYLGPASLLCVWEWLYHKHTCLYQHSRAILFLLLYYLLYSDAFDLQFGVAIFRLRAGFDVTDIDDKSGNVVAAKKTSDESPPIMGERKESTIPLLPMSSSPKPKQ